MVGLPLLLALLALLAPLGWSAAEGAAPAFTYRSIAAMPFGTNEAESVVVNDKLYVFGGFDTTKATFTPTSRAWVYDPAANTWHLLATMPVNGITHAGIATDGTRYVYYAGGNASAQNATQQVYGSTDAFRYDTVSNVFSRMPSLPSPRSAGGLAYVAGRLYYFGGNNLDRTQDPSDVWMLDVADGSTRWVSEAPLPNPRNHMGWGVINGEIYAVGGQYVDLSNLAQSSLDRYDPASNTWTVLANMPIARSHIMDSTFVLNGQLVVAGGWTTTAVSAAVLAYDPASNTWSTLPNLPEARTSATAKSISGGRFLFCCGSAGSSAQTGWIALPSGTPAPTGTAPGTTPTPAGTPTSNGPTTKPPTSKPTTSKPTVSTSPGHPTSAGPTSSQPAPILAAPTLGSATSPTPTGTPGPGPSLSPTPSPPRQLLARLSGLALRPSTVRAAHAGAVLVAYRLSHSARVTLVLRRCTSSGCSVLVTQTVGSPAGAQHVSLHTLTGHGVLSVAHYRVDVTAAGGRTTTLHLVVTS